MAENENGFKYIKEAKFFAKAKEDKYIEREQEDAPYVNVARAIYNAALFGKAELIVKIVNDQGELVLQDSTNKQLFVYREDGFDNYLHRRNDLKRGIIKHSNQPIFEKQGKERSCKKIDNVTYQECCIFTPDFESEPKPKYLIDYNMDDDIFAWLLLCDFYSKTSKWDTIKMFSENKVDFYVWFINKCNPNENNQFELTQKWHLFEYLLYTEMNEKYHFSKSEGNLYKTSHGGLWNWMADSLLKEKKLKEIERKEIEDKLKIFNKHKRNKDLQNSIKGLFLKDKTNA